MNGETLYPIGELARQTGLTVKTIRFYSDHGIVTPTSRSPAGYRLYNTDAVARLDLVRTLRALGLDLPTIRKITDRELTLPDVAAAHAEALALQIRVLNVRRAVLTAVAERGSTPEETERMHRLAQLSEDERRRLTDDFLNAAFADRAAVLAGPMRSMTPELPDNPETAQIQAWLQLAEMSLDPDFRATLRQMADDHAAEHTRTHTTGPRRDIAAAIRDHAGPALTAGIDPTSPQADPIIAQLTAYYARLLGHPDNAELRRRLTTRLDNMNDPRRERYLHLLATVNGWPAPDNLTPVFNWTLKALHARTPEHQ